ncbi:casein kinase 2 regulatory subunit [Basidiobolus ranarum]|uniref:Casein kinase II subunit beta n=1 Tax=Basidiobolus ranarum TaxID=34480 RepID=A0ABR2VLY0_9FUNG
MDPVKTQGSSKVPVNGEEYSVTTDSAHDSDHEKISWVTWFCSLPGKEYLVEVADNFLEDDFNFTGLGSTVPFYQEALEMILDIEPERKYSGADTSLIESSAERLYGLIHQRYILTRQGMNEMANKYDHRDFGDCPRYYCNGVAVVPTGRSDSLGIEPVRLYCPNCLDIYTPPSSRFQDLDGAFFGATFAHLFFMTFNPSIYTHFKVNTYTPRIYGFKVSELSKSGPCNRWLRSRYNQNDDSSESPSESDDISDTEEVQGIIPRLRGTKIGGVDKLTRSTYGETTSQHDVKSERSSISRFFNHHIHAREHTINGERKNPNVHNKSRNSTLCTLC